MENNYKICAKCIMDTSDPDILFDDKGICNHCILYEKATAAYDAHSVKTKSQLDDIVGKVKDSGKNRRYDCIIGVSGGVDSSYAAFITKTLGLRPLAVHLDNGWNSELAVNNIELLLKKLDIDLYTYVIDWEEFKDLQVAFLKASTPDSEIPTDHAIQALQYKIASKEKIKYIITGNNLATEGYGVSAWSQGHGDWHYINSIHKQFGKLSKLKSFPHYGIIGFVYYKLLKRIKTISILDYIPYKKSEALQILQEKFHYKPYRGKHGESTYTAFYQGYILPEKFGYDKRRIHLSALISAGEISREEALAEMENPPYPVELVSHDKEYVAKKLGLQCQEFDDIMAQDQKSFWDYPSFKKSRLLRNKFIRKMYYRLRK